MTIKNLALSLSLAIGIGITPAVAQNTAVAGENVTLALVGGRVIDGFGGQPLDNAVVLVAGERIVHVGSAATTVIPEGVQVIDTNGKTVLPGLWESHGHLFHVGEGRPDEFPTKFAHKAKEVMAVVAKTTLQAGITSFRDTGGPLDQQFELRKDINEGRIPGPRLYFSGIYLKQGKPKPIPSNCKGVACVPNFVETPAQARQAVEKLIQLGVDNVKVYGFWDLDLLSVVVDTAHKHGIGVDADVRHKLAYEVAIKAGVDRLHHVFFADAISDYSDDELRFMIRGNKPAGGGPLGNIQRGPFILPTVQMREAYVRVVEFGESIDHPERCKFSADVCAYLFETWAHPASVPWGIGALQRVPAAKAKLRRFIEAGGREQIVAGTDAGSPFNFHPPVKREIRNLHEAGLSPMEAIQAATLRAAQLQGVEKDFGTVTPGKYADLIVVDGNPLADLSLIEHKVTVVIKNGQVVDLND